MLRRWLHGLTRQVLVNVGERLLRRHRVLTPNDVLIPRLGGSGIVDKAPRPLHHLMHSSLSKYPLLCGSISW